MWRNTKNASEIAKKGENCLKKAANSLQSLPSLQSLKFFRKVLKMVNTTKKASEDSVKMRRNIKKASKVAETIKKRTRSGGRAGKASGQSSKYSKSQGNT